MYEDHHYYGHVQDVSDINFSKYMFGIPALFVLIAFALATGLWPVLIILWLFWPKGSS